jgi:mono/diheme cytochrome c family protein
MVRSAAVVSVLVAAAAVAAEPAKVDYSRDVRPILSEFCFKCHGPGTQKAGIRLDNQQAAMKKGSLTPGKPEKSELYLRVVADKDEERMPPPEDGKTLNAKQVATLKAWIEQGGEYAPHWAFVPPVKPKPPADGHPVDAFVETALRKQGLKPSPEADRSTLVRRVTLDLIGLLPSPEEVDAFRNDASPNAYEKLVDRLLASEHYGERQARHWLDLARYADSNGYTIDGARSIWPYRDWVIAAFNKDLPFDRFTIEQLAGDLLPKATKDQLVATGFHRNTSFNEEGGTDAEQFRVERTIDRTNTTGAVWLGLTVSCAQCHDHKYDPFTQKDYFRLYAYFNSCDEPQISLGGTPELERQIAKLTEELAKLRLSGDDEAVKKKLAELKAVEKKTTTTLVMKERPKPRESFIQIRGDFLRKGEVVTPGYPHALSTEESKGSRLDLAKWLVSPRNPLTARVFVNRAWQQFFGKGLVETENDFGMQGSIPTHPELLDWLAAEFQSGAKPWGIKHLHRLIVTSATYKRSSKARTDLAAADPQNKLLGRQNRLRLEAEILRDAALTASGLLNRKVGGPGVYPPMPPEVFSFTQNKHPWPESQGPDRYRRGMYTHIWRQSQHHLLTTFDAADAQTACTKRNRSNTPLQALHLANDIAFQEFAKALGDRVEKEGPADTAGRIALAFEICFSRKPSAKEAERLAAFADSAAKEDAKTAWARTARVLLNLDEFVTRE